jgi:hypothetical protein
VHHRGLSGSRREVVGTDRLGTRGPT